MPSRIVAGETEVQLFLEDSPLVAGLKGAETKLRAWGSTIQGIGSGLTRVGGGIVAALGAGIMVGTFQKLLGWVQDAATGARTTGAEFVAMAARTGLSVEALSALDYAASQTGTSLKSVLGGLGDLQGKLLSAAMGGREAAQTLGALGISFAAFQGMNPETQIMTLAAAFQRIPDAATRSALALRLFGQNGLDLLPLLTQGPAGLRAFAAEAQRSGLLLSTAEARAAAAFDQALSKMGKAAERLGQTISFSIFPTVTKWVEKINEYVKTGIQFVAQNQELIAGIFRMGVVIASAGAALMVTGTIFTKLGSVIGGFVSAIKIGSSIFGGLVSVLGFAVSPLGLLTAGVIGLGAAFLAMRGTTGAVIEWLGRAFTILRDEATESFGAISHAMVAGDMQAAARVLWTLLQLEWARGIAAINTAWAGCQKFFMDIWDSAVAWFNKVWIDPIGTFERTWLAAIGKIGEAFVAMLQWAHMIDAATAETMKADVRRQTAYKSRAAEPADPETKKKLAEIDAAREKAAAARQTQHDDKIKAAEQDVVAARAALGIAIETAKAAKKSPGELPPFGGPEGKLGEADFTGRGMQPMGTFSATAARGLALGGSIFDRIARASEQTERNTRKIGEVAVVWR